MTPDSFLQGLDLLLVGDGFIDQEDQDPAEEGEEDYPPDRRQTPKGKKKEIKEYCDDVKDKKYKKINF